MVIAEGVGMRRYVGRPVSDVRCAHAEGPCWDARAARLLWIDQFDGLVHVAAVDSGGNGGSGSGALRTERTYALGAAVGAIAPLGAAGAGWVVAYRRGFGLLAEDGTVTRLAQPEEDVPAHTRMNDGKCDAAGRFWAGSMAWDKRTGAGTLYRLDPDLRVSVALRDLTISNGLCWPVDDPSRMYFIDTPTGRVDSFRVTEFGDLTERSPVVGHADGLPDGMCIDEDGCLWVARWGAGAVHRYGPDGALLAVVQVDAPQVSSCCFGGVQGNILFITTSQEGMSSQQRAADHMSGHVFAVEVDAVGRPAAPFGGAGAGVAE